MSSSSDGVFGITTGNFLTVGTGGSLTQFIGVDRLQTSVMIKAGATCILFGTTTGSTMAGASIVAGFSLGYPMAAGEVITLDGPCPFYVGAAGATAAVHILKGLTPPGYTGTNGQ